MTRRYASAMQRILWIFIACLALVAAPAARSQPAAAPQVVPPQVRQPTSEENAIIRRGFRSIMFYLNIGGIGSLIIEQIDAIEPLMKETYGPDHPEVLALSIYRGLALSQDGKPVEAEQVLSALAARMEKLPRVDRALVRATRVQRANASIARMNLAQAERLLQDNIRDTAATPGALPAESAANDEALANVRRMQGRFADAERLLRGSLAATGQGNPGEKVTFAIRQAALARALTGLGRIEEAVQLVTTAIAGHPEDDPAKARLLFALAEAQAEQDRAADAQDNYRKSAVIATKAFGFDAPVAIQAASLARQQQLRAAGWAPLVEENIPSYRPKCPDQMQSSVDVDKAMEIAAHHYTSHEHGSECLSKALAFIEGAAGGDVPVALAVRERLADILDRGGDTDPAETLARAVLAGRERINGPDHPAAQRAAILFARVLGHQGKAEESRSLLARAKGPALAGARIVEAHLLSAAGNFPAAARAWETAMNVVGAQPRPLLPNLLETLSGTITNQILSGKCPTELKESLAQVAAQQTLATLANGNLLQEAQAMMLTCDGKWQEADAIYRLLEFSSNRGVVHQDPSKALLMARKAIVFSRSPENFQIANSAADEASGIARERRFTPDRDSAGKPLGFRRNRTATGADPLALAFAARTIVSWAQAPTLTEDYMREGYASGAFVAVQDYTLSSAAASLLQSAARRSVKDAELGTLIDRQVAVATRLDTAERAVIASGKPADDATRGRMEAGRTELASLTDQLRRRFPAFAESSRPFGLSFADLRQRLRPGEAVLLIQPVGDEIYSFAVSGGSHAWNKASISRRDMDRLVTLLRCRIDRDNCPLTLPDKRLFDPASAYRLFQTLIEPVSAGLGDAKLVYTVAGGSLSGIPLGILLTSHDPKNAPADELAELAASPWLAQRYALAALPSVSSLRAFGKPAVAQIEFAGVGDPVLGPPASTQRGGKPAAIASTPGAEKLANPAEIGALHSLPGTRRELTALSRALGEDRSQLKLGADAREGAVKDWPALSQARIVAFATHALLPNELSSAAEPGLIFTPPPRATATDDGYLTASEAAQLQLNAEWVILSACNTAGPDGRPGGESLSGLGRAFLLAGARSLLVSHWPVNDTVGAAITSETFRIMAAKPETSRAEGFRLALQGIRSGTSALGGPIPGWAPAWADPWAWAPFSLIESGS